MNNFSVIIFLIVVLCEGSSTFDKKNFLDKCVSRQGCYAECSTCTICKNVNINKSDSKSFVSNSYNLVDTECVVFAKGDLGIVNSDFFKQFPDVRRMYFRDTTLSLKSSEMIVPHTKMVMVKCIKCTLNDTKQSNAFKSLVNLRKLELIRSGDINVDELWTKNQRKSEKTRIIRFK